LIRCHSKRKPGGGFPFDWIRTPDAGELPQLLEHSASCAGSQTACLSHPSARFIAIGTSADGRLRIRPLQFPGRSVLFWLLAMLMIPGEVTLIPQYMLQVGDRWVNSYQASSCPVSPVPTASS